MSLNGLDDSAVVQAHQNALADPGGWFFLKYSNRDTVELLSRGTGGVAEAKNAVEQYREKSPLYGMLQYRRKRVLLKYVPEGTSRLLQVRLTVQFQSILDAFPHDTVFSFTAAAELVESALGLCTMLLPTAGGSLKSSDSSLRQRRLNEISEDVEEPIIPVKKEEPRFARLLESIDNGRVSENDDLSRLPASALRAKALLAKRKQENLSLSLSQSSVSLQAPLAQPTNHATSQIEAPPRHSEPAEPLASLSQLKLRDDTDSVRRIDTDSVDLPVLPYHHSRHLSETESASISQWNDQVMAYTLPGPKPAKKKLAPRPHVDNTARPRTANTYDENIPPRPVANLPTTVRVSNRPNPATIARPGSQQSSRSVPARFTPTPGLPPPLPDLNLQSLYKRPESRKAGSVTSATTDAATASPEKLRLMKALQNRKRNQILTSRAASAQSNLTTLHDDFPLGMHPVEKPMSNAPVPPTIREETQQVPQDTKSAHESSTASPTSITSTSEDPSTRPSSFAEERESPASQKSSSHDTDSASTPKAITAVPQTSSSVNPEYPQNKSSAPAISVSSDGHTHSRNSNTSTIHASSAQFMTSRKPEQPAFSWLASDKEVEMLQSQVLSAETPLQDQHRGSHLSVNGLGSPTTECSSVMSEDDALVEELRKATVHEATPMSVTRPPLTPTMRTYSHDRSRATTLTGSITTPKSSRSAKDFMDNSPAHSGSRSISTALPQIPSGSVLESTGMSLAKKAALGNGISKRIKALEDSSRGNNSSSSIPQDSTTTRSTLSNMMKRNSFISQFQGSHPSTDKPIHQEATYKLEKPSAIIPQSPRMQLRPGLSSHKPTQHDRQLSATMSSSVYSDNNTMSDSPLNSTPDRKRFSFTSYRSGTTNRSNAKWMHPESMASRVSLNKENRVPKAPGSETSSVNEDKRTSRATRLMKRVSGFGSRFGGKGQMRTGSRDESRPYPIMEQHEPPARSESVAESTMQMVDIGDVNVQFPETLLWKRRFLRIDDQGYLIFQAPTDSQNVRATSRKFHLADVQEPCLPDSEREEIAWSVLLDLRDGNCVQCACESKQGQAHVLKMLLDAHSAYHSLYPHALE